MIASAYSYGQFVEAVSVARGGGGFSSGGFKGGGSISSFKGSSGGSISTFKGGGGSSISSFKGGGTGFKMGGISQSPNFGKFGQNNFGSKMSQTGSSGITGKIGQLKNDIGSKFNNIGNKFTGQKYQDSMSKNGLKFGSYKDNWRSSQVIGGAYSGYYSPSYLWVNNWLMWWQMMYMNSLTMSMVADHNNNNNDQKVVVINGTSGKEINTNS